MTNRSDLSERQQAMLEMIAEYTDEYGYPPTIREIGEACDISSTSVVSYNLNALQRKGYLSRDPDVSRGLRLVHDQDTSGEGSAGNHSLGYIPMLGEIAAGEPIPVPDSDFSSTDYETLAITPDIVDNVEDVYALRVRGNSMIDALINDGDIVIMRHQRTAENGEMVAAWLKEEKATTLKHFHWPGGTQPVRLQPANPSMDPIYVHPANLEIHGRVIGVIRQLDRAKGS